MLFPLITMEVPRWSASSKKPSFNPWIPGETIPSGGRNFKPGKTFLKSLWGKEKGPTTLDGETSLKYLISPPEMGGSPNGLWLARAEARPPERCPAGWVGERELSGHHSSAFAPERFFERVIRSKQ